LNLHVPARVKSLLAKIEANAAKRLPLPAGRKPAEELARYKGFLKEESHRLKILHRGGEDGLAVCRARSEVMDVMIRHIWESVQLAVPASGRSPRIALVAFGGYGRGELNPCSDIDLMFLHSGGLDPGRTIQATLGEWTSGLLYTLWDIGLKVGHAVRTVEDCITVANTDMQSKTSLLEARLVTGDQKLFQQMQTKFVDKCVHGHEDEYIAQRLTDQATRRGKHGDSAAMQEPNIKNGCGGLRDYQNLLWMIFFKLGCRTTAELQQADQINSAERKQLESAYDFLLRTRNELHYVTGRPVDVLAANIKPAVATGLGYSDRSPRTRVEHFMRDYYTHTRNVYLITRTLEQRLALVPSPLWGLRRLVGRRAVKPAIADEVDGFRIVGTQLTASSRNVLRDDPHRLMRAFLHAQKRGLTLHPDLAQFMRQAVTAGLVDRSFTLNRQVRETFIEILNERGNVAPTLRAMHEVGFLGKYLPEFGRLTNLVQHEFYHQYAVDEHTLVCLAKLDQVWDAAKPPFSEYTQIFQSLERPYVLHLALLLHDCGKAIPGRRHEIVGGELALRAGNRLRLDAATTATLRLLIEQHLAMVQISQRRDLEDPEVIHQFATQIQGLEHLDLLTLHTFADSMGTSDTLWNGFKDSLLWQLWRKTREALSGGSEFIRAERKQRELLREEVREILPKTFSEEEIDAHFTGLPPRYFQIHPPRAIARDLTLAHRFMHLQITEADHALEPVFVWHDEPDRGYTGLHLCTWDRVGLFARLTGALAATGLNILAAQIYTRTDGVVLDDFFVTDARTGKVPDTAVRERFEKTALEVLTHEVDPARLLARAPTYAPLYRSVGGESLSTTIRFDNATSAKCTVIDLETEDRVGLLFALSSALSELGLNLVLAKIVTEKGAAIDSFYVTDANGGKITGAVREKQIEKRLVEAVAWLNSK
jgi:[protein-PII] uridylyltransferase